MSVCFGWESAMVRIDWRAAQALALAAALLVAGASGSQAAEASMQRTVTVSAEGSVSARPDIAFVSAGVVTEAETAQAALADNSTLMTALISNLKANGIAAEDVQTSSFNVSPKYDHRRDGSAPRITGYSVSNQVRAAVRELKRVGEVLDILVKGGANQIGGLSFDIGEPEALRDKARKAAFERARQRAALYAEAGGAKLGEVLTISEGAAHTPRGEPMRLRAAMAEAVPIEAGSQDIAVHVTVTWALDR